MNRSVYSFLHFPASDMTTGGYIVTDGQHQYGGYASTKCRGRLQYPSTCNAEGAEEPSPQQKKKQAVSWRFRHEKRLRNSCFVTHALRRSQFSPSESPSRPFLRFRSVFPAENFAVRKFSAGNRRENAQTRRNGRTLMKRGETSAGRMVS